MIPGKDRPLKVFMSAGESSGDVLGGRLAAALAEKCPAGIEVQGVGGPEMAAQGLRSLFPMSELALMGLVEVLPHIPRLKRRIAETAAAAQAAQPDVLITIDAPGFNKRMAAACAGMTCPKIHYVAPTVWAWRPGRVHKFKKLFDSLLCLLPFEPPYFKAVGLDARFVGHSILESGADKGDGIGFRRRLGLAEDSFVLCVLPGSRSGEIKCLLPVFQKAVAQFCKGNAGRDVRIVMPAVPHLRGHLEEVTAMWPMPVHLVDPGDKYDAMAASDLALAASGTVALELAIAKVPTVIAYRLNTLTYWILRRLVRTRYAHLLNITADREIVPEALQDDCTPERIARHLTSLIGAAGAQQIETLTPILETLRPEGAAVPSIAAAEAVLEIVQKRKRGPEA